MKRYGGAECNFVADLDGPSGDLQSSDVKLDAFLARFWNYQAIFWTYAMVGSYNGYNIPAGIQINIKTLVERVQGKFESTSCEATVSNYVTFAPLCDCSCNLCNNGNGNEVNCDACVLIPTNSSGLLLPPTDINYPTTTECINIKV
jgi:hypothetical protein